MQSKITLLKNIINAGLLVFCLSVNAQNKIDGLAVVVGKNIVLDSDIERFKQDLELQSNKKIQISDCEMLEELMKQKLLAHHGVIDSVMVSDKDVNSRVERSIAYFKQQYGSTEKVLKAYEVADLPELKKELRRVYKEKALVEREQAKITSKVSITPEETRLYFKNLKDKNELPEFPAEVEIAQIVLYAEPTDAERDRIVKKLSEIKKQIEDGASFKMKAIINSDDPSVTQNSGNMGLIKKDSPFIKEFKEVAFSLEEGEISEPFKTIFGYHIVKLNKVRGDARDVSHILMQPEISDEKLKETEKELMKIKADIESNKISFKEAVKKYSEDKETSEGLLINPYTRDSKFELTRMDPALYGRTYKLKKGQLGDVFYDETRGGEKMYKVYFMKNRTDTHKANLNVDYVKIQQLALQKKKQEAIDKWADKKISDTYIKIGKEYKKCKFKQSWMKKN